MNRRGFLAGLAALWAAKRLPAEAPPLPPVKMPLPVGTTTIATTAGTATVTCTGGLPIYFDMQRGVWYSIGTTTTNGTTGATLTFG